jgi:hypothetical protein
MRAEVVFLKAGNVMHRHEFTVNVAADFAKGVKEALDDFHRRFPYVSLMDSGVSFLVQRAGQN